jgi:hypothetical protein
METILLLNPLQYLRDRIERKGESNILRHNSSRKRMVRLRRGKTGETTRDSSPCELLVRERDIKIH